MALLLVKAVYWYSWLCVFAVAVVFVFGLALVTELVAWWRGE